MSVHSDNYICWTCFGPEVFLFSRSYQVVHSQEIRAESQSRSRPAEALVLSEVKDLQAELQDTLKALQQQQDPANLLDDDKVHRTTFRL